MQWRVDGREERSAEVACAALFIGALLALMLLWVLAWLALPPLLKWQLETRGSQLLGRPLSVGEIQFAPARLALTLRDLSVGAAPGNADTTPQLQIDRLFIDIDARSLLRLAPVVEGLEIDAPRLRLARLGDGRYDIDDLLQRLAPKPGEPPSEPARFALFNLRLAGGEMRFDDSARGPHACAGQADTAVALPVEPARPYPSQGRAAAGFRTQWQRLRQPGPIDALRAGPSLGTDDPLRRARHGADVGLRAGGVAGAAPRRPPRCRPAPALRAAAGGRRADRVEGPGRVAGLRAEAAGRGAAAGLEEPSHATGPGASVAAPAAPRRPASGRPGAARPARRRWQSAVAAPGRGSGGSCRQSARGAADGAGLEAAAGPAGAEGRAVALVRRDAAASGRSAARAHSVAAEGAALAGRRRCRPAPGRAAAGAGPGARTTAGRRHAHRPAGQSRAATGRHRPGPGRALLAPVAASAGQRQAEWRRHAGLGPWRCAAPAAGHAETSHRRFSTGRAARRAGVQAAGAGAGATGAAGTGRSAGRPAAAARGHRLAEPAAAFHRAVARCHRRAQCQPLVDRAACHRCQRRVRGRGGAAMATGAA